jgi:outer membrane protein assembly factor BamB
MLHITHVLRCVFVLMVFAAVDAAGAEDWPQWRGPNRDGACHERGLLESFPADGLQVRWRVPVGWGFSSPIVSQGRVYVADSLLAQPQAKEQLHCFDEETGDELWTQSYEVLYPEWAFDPSQEIGPVATPIARDGKVYTVGRLGHVFCLDARTGDELWKRELGPARKCGRRSTRR